jgi:hypothetical protein
MRFGDAGLHRRGLDQIDVGEHFRAAGWNSRIARVVGD